MYVGTSDEERLQLATHLQEIDFCERCVLRFLGERDFHVYRSNEEIAKKLSSLVPDEVVEGNGSPAAKRKASNICSACLGLLQEKYLQEYKEKVIELVKTSGYKSNSFSLQLSVPVTVDLRQHVFWNYLSDKFSVLYAEKKSYDIPGVKDVWKWTTGAYFSSALGLKFNSQSAYQVNVIFNHKNIEEECSFLMSLHPNMFPRTKATKKKFLQSEMYTRCSVQNALNLCNLETLKSKCLWPPESPSTPCLLDAVECSHSPLYLAGRYKKYSRNLCQTPWIVDGEKKMENSVQEFITDVVEKNIVSDKIVFSSSGREDVDVRMLGTGRPFVLEILNPRKNYFSKEELKLLQKEINSATEEISIHDFQVVTREELEHLKEGEEHKKKTYTALCCCSRPLTPQDLEMLSSIRDLKIQQKTPIRVLQRRPLALRERTIYSINVTVVEPKVFKLGLVTQAGTYIKEFVHSDFGRTTPSIRSLLNADADIMELDVEFIDLDWPPHIDDS